MQDMQLQMQEVNELMEQSYALDAVDEGELDAEFAALEEEIALDQFNQAMDVKIASGGAPSYLPERGGGAEIATERLA